jgi:hypothetical protein
MNPPTDVVMIFQLHAMQICILVLRDTLDRPLDHAVHDLAVHAAPWTLDWRPISENHICLNTFTFVSTLRRANLAIVASRNICQPIIDVLFVRPALSIYLLSRGKESKES